MIHQPLQHCLEQIQSHLTRFQHIQASSERSYQSALLRLADRNLCALLMEQHLIQAERQRIAIARLQRLRDQVQRQLASQSQSEAYG